MTGAARPVGFPHELFAPVCARDAGSIVLVCDSPQRIEATSRVLSDNSVHGRLHVVGSGTAALRHLHSGSSGDQEEAGGPRPSLVLLDLTTAGMNGFDFLIHLRADPATREVPVVALSTVTARTSTRELLSGQEHADDDSFPKPSTADELLATLQALGVVWLDLTPIRLSTPVRRAPSPHEALRVSAVHRPYRSASAARSRQFARVGERQARAS